MRWEYSYGLDINRMTKNPNQGFYNYYYYCYSFGWGGTGWVGTRGRAGVQGKERVRRRSQSKIFLTDTIYLPYTYCYTFSSNYFIRLPCNGLHKNNFRNLTKGRNCKKIRKGKQSFVYMTQCVNLIYIAIKFHHEISMGNLVMGCAKTVLKLSKGT